MGPTRTTSCSDYQYALSKFIEFSSIIEKEFGQKVKCLRSDNGGEFMSISIIEKEYGQKLKCLRSDNGGEFMSTKFFQFCEENGIQR